MASEIFTDADLIVNQDAPDEEKRAWKNRAPEVRNNVHIGQLKLLGSEIAFFTLGTSEEVAKCTVVYAGAAGGHHIPALAYLYPNTKFYLYDPAPFAIESSHQLHIINGMFTDDVAREWGRSGERVLFISDVRTSGDTAEEHESEVEANMLMQARWIELMQPSLRGYSLKFRIPFTIIEADKPYRYLGGTLLYQPYPKADSMELRLIGNADDAKAGAEAVIYDSRSLERIVFYHNSIIRPIKSLYANVFTGTMNFYEDPQFNNSYDCSYFLYCIRRYLDLKGFRYNLESTGLDIARRLIAMTSQGKWTLGQRLAPREEQPVSRHIVQRKRYDTVRR